MTLRQPTITHLCGQHNQRHTDHDDHVQLRRPDVRHKVTVSDRREGHHHVVGALEQVQVSMAGALKVLYATHAAAHDRYTNRRLVCYI